MPPLRARSRTARCVPVLLAIAACVATPRGARADVVGRLHFSVKNAADEKPIAGAKITLHDTANVRPDFAVTTDAQGSAVTAPLDTRPWHVTTEAENFQTDARDVTPVADTTTEVETLLEPLKEKVITITAGRLQVNKSQTNNVTHLDPTFLEKFPVTAGNPQSLSNILRSTPGMSPDSVNQVHPRGEHSNTGISINGFYLPGALQGRAGQLIIPEVIQSLDVVTGGFAPEYGGDTAAILNLSLRSGPITPFKRFVLEGGEYQTWDGSLALGGQLGAPIGAPNASGQSARRFGYLMDVSGRHTDNYLEPPQPDDQTAHNEGFSSSYFGNFNFHGGTRDEVTGTLNSSPAHVDVANRTGLPDSYASVGQGFGFGGALSAADAAAMGIPSQQTDGQDIYQKDANDFGVLNWRHTFNDRMTGLLAFGGVYSGQDVRNHNPPVNLQALPADSSIEYGPTIIRNYHHFQPEGSVTYSSGKHTFKFGLLDDEQSGHESYNLVPGSQVALDALYATDPRLAPPGTPQVGPDGNPVLDSQGNQVYQIAPNATTVPTLSLDRDGFYRAFYLQDTWNTSHKLTLNYGVRGDWYKQEQNIGTSEVELKTLSPRFNLAYAATPRTIVRLFYDHLFQQPPLAQGAILGEPIRPETLDLFEANVEYQIAPRQTVKVAAYHKDIKNQIDTGLLIPSTQIGVFTSVSLDRGNIDAVEFSVYYLTPQNNVGLGAYVTYTNATDKPSGFDNTGEPAPTYNDHDQLNTINAGLSYTLPSGALAGLDFYYGTGLASSVVFDDNREPRAFLNLRFSSGPHLLAHGHGGVALNIENVLDRTSVINYNSAFSGTRFQQGRRILLSLFGNF